jgi:membrane dipeptidase
MWLIKSARDLEDALGLWWVDRKPGLVLLMEGADPIVQVRDLPNWWRRGFRRVCVSHANARALVPSP